MGLDSHVYVAKLSQVVNDFEFTGEREEFYYWRKNWGMHHAMRRVFMRKGGDVNKSQFNCDYIRLNLDDILFLEKDTDWMDLHSDYRSSHKEDLDFFKKAKKRLSQNDCALYFMSWY